MKIAYFGTADFSKNIASSLYKNDDIEIVLCVCQPDKEIGRKKIMTSPALKKFAVENNIAVLQPAKLRNNTEFFKILEGLDLDFIVVVAYGKIIPTEILDIPKYGCINLHGSILPAYRGASPVQEALKQGDSETGLTVMYMSQGMDEGDCLKIEKIVVDKGDTAPDIFQKFEDIGPELLSSTLQKIIDGKIKSSPQDDEKVSYCGKISKQDGEIFFSQMTAQTIKNRYRAYISWPGIYSYFNGKKISFEEISLEENGEKNHIPGSIVQREDKLFIAAMDGKCTELVRVKLEGKKTMHILDFINGNEKFLTYKFDSVYV